MTKHEKPVLQHSYSSISMFEKCPLRYYRQRILKDVVDKPTIHTDFGTAVHFYIENQLNKWSSNGSYDDSHDFSMVDVNTKSVADKYIAAIKAITTLKELNCYTEQMLCVDEALKPVDFFAEGYLRAIVDVLLVSEHSDTAYIYDWKTGKRRPDVLQLAICSALVFEHYKHVKKIRAGFVWLKKDIDAADTYKFYRRDLASIWVDILSRTKRIEAASRADVWQPMPSGLCKWCPANTSCEFAQL